MVQEFPYCRTMDHYGYPRIDLAALIIYREMPMQHANKERINIDLYVHAVTTPTKRVRYLSF